MLGLGVIGSAGATSSSLAVENRLVPIGAVAALSLTVPVFPPIPQYASNQRFFTNTRFEHQGQPQWTVSGSYNLSMPRDHAKAFVDRMKHLLELQDDWNSFGARRVRVDVAVFALGFVAALRPFMGDSWPQVVPTESGGLQMEWHLGAGVVEVALDGERRELFARDARTGHEVEGPLETYLASLPGYLARFRG